MRSLRAINHVWSWFGRASAALGFVLLLTVEPAHAQNVRVSGLSNVAFGSIANLQLDAVRNQDLCAFSSSAGKRYSVRATGSGSSGAFTLAAGTRTLAYEVQWNSSAGQATGISLSSGVTQGGFVTIANNQNCGGGTGETASLIVILRAAALSSAVAGNYSGTLTVTLAPE